uniref:Glycosyltransferase 2-like domain-containing protein n=1 Tax=viral metagenome TaxID=1070528 RepID=A0A6C0KW93_9ZZZZ
MTLCLIAIFKNEASIINEWITHYINQGVDKFFLINNDSTDQSLEIIQPYIDKNIVECVMSKERHAQKQLYNKHFLDKSKEYHWAMVVDLDEFIYARKGCRTIKEYLHTLDDSIAQICVPWKMFGSNGYKIQPQYVIESFTKRIYYDKDDGFQGIKKDNGYKYSLNKCIVRTTHLKQFAIHSHEMLNKNHITSDNTINNLHSDVNFSKIDETILENSYLHLNHYAIQSYDWFMKVKATRGAADNPKSENVRNNHYFVSYDIVSNDMDDFELKEITYE